MVHWVKSAVSYTHLDVYKRQAETLQERYHLFLELNRTKDREQLRQEIADLEQRLRESRQYAGQPKEQLEVEFTD